jgi:cobalamin biosynthesis protein CobD/CbiB
LHAMHPPLWATIVIEAAVETVAVSLTAAIILVVFWALIGGADPSPPTQRPRT